MARTVAEALDAFFEAEGCPLPRQLLLDTLCELAERGGAPEPVEDDEWDGYVDAVYAWARSRNVIVRI